MLNPDLITCIFWFFMLVSPFKFVGFHSRFTQTNTFCVPPQNMTAGVNPITNDIFSEPILIWPLMGKRRKRNVLQSFSSMYLMISTSLPSFFPLSNLTRRYFLISYFLDTVGMLVCISGMSQFWFQLQHWPKSMILPVSLFLGPAVSSCVSSIPSKKAPDASSW